MSQWILSFQHRTTLMITIMMMMMMMMMYFWRGAAWPSQRLQVCCQKRTAAF